MDPLEARHLMSGPIVAAVHFLGKIASAVYDDATHTVTLSPNRAFNARDRFRRLKVKARGDNAVRDALSVALDGNGNGKSGDGANIPFRLVAAFIQQLSGVQFAVVPLLDNPSFQVGVVNP